MPSPNTSTSKNHINTTRNPSIAIPSTSTPKGHYTDDLHSPTSPRRPSFCSTKTSDRLSESARVPSFRLCTIQTDSKKERRSVFKELGLEDDDIKTLDEKLFPATPSHTRSNSDTSKQRDTQQAKLRKERAGEERYTPALTSVDERKSWYSKLTSGRRPQIKSASSAPTGLATLPRVAMIAFLLAIVIPGFLTKGPNGVPADGANAGVIKARDVDGAGQAWKREDSPTDTCTRWSHQAAVLNGTLYIYGGQSKAKADQEENTWSKHPHFYV